MNAHVTRLISRSLSALITAAVLYIYWAYAFYQDFGWLEISLITVLITMAALMVSVVVDAAIGSVPLKTYLRRYSFRLMLLVAAFGFIVPGWLYVAVLLNPLPDSCSGVIHFCLSFRPVINYLNTNIALLIAFEMCAVLIGVLRLSKPKTSKKTK